MSLHKNTVKLSVGNTTKSKFKMAHQIHSTNPTDANHKKKKTIATFTTKKNCTKIATSKDISLRLFNFQLNKIIFFCFV